MMLDRVILLSLVCTTVCISTCDADLIYAHTSGDTLFTIDSATGGRSIVGLTGLTSIAGLAIDSSGTLFASDNQNQQLVTLDRTTAIPTVVGSFGLGTTIDGMSIDPITGQLFGIEEDGSQRFLVTIHKTTASVTRIGGPIGFTAVNAMAIDGSGAIFASESDTEQLISINRTTGMGTSIGQLGFDFVTGLTFTSDGTLFASNVDDLLTIDTSTGAGTFHSTGLGGFTSLAALTTAVPEPSSFSSLILTVGLILSRRRRCPRQH